MIDSGYSNHITSYHDDFSHLQQGTYFARTANDDVMQMYSPGIVIFQQEKTGAISIVLHDIWYTPNACNRLLFVNILTKAGFTWKIMNQVKIQDNQEKVVIQAISLFPPFLLH